MSLQTIGAWGGSEHINAADGAQTNKAYRLLVVQEDGTTITVMTGSYEGNTVNYRTQCNLVSKELKANALIKIPEGQVISSLTVGAGSVIAYK